MYKRQGLNTGSNPDPSGFYGAKAAFNLPRYTSPAMQEVLDKISSNKALDEEFRTNAYKEFQALAMEEVPYIPTRFSTDWIVINNRIKHFDYRPYVEGEPVSYTHLDVYKRQKLYYFSNSFVKFQIFFVIIIRNNFSTLYLNLKSTLTK